MAEILMLFYIPIIYVSLFLDVIEGLISKLIFLFSSFYLRHAINSYLVILLYAYFTFQKHVTPTLIVRKNILVLLNIFWSVFMVIVCAFLEIQVKNYFFIQLSLFILFYFLIIILLLLLFVHIFHALLLPCNFFNHIIEILNIFFRGIYMYEEGSKYTDLMLHHSISSYFSNLIVGV